MRCLGCASTLTDGDDYCWPCRDRNRHRELSTTDVVALTGASLRQLTCWASSGLIIPTVRAEHSRETPRVFAWRDALKTSAVVTLLDAGWHLPNLRKVLAGDTPEVWVRAETLVLDGPAPARFARARLTAEFTGAGHGGYPYTVLPLAPLALDLDRRSRRLYGDRRHDEILEEAHRGPELHSRYH